MVEASIRQMVQDETTRILAAAQSGEQTALDREAVIVDHIIDRLKREIFPAITQTPIPAINQVAAERETQFLDRMETVLQSYGFGFVKATQEADLSPYPFKDLERLEAATVHLKFTCQPHYAYANDNKLFNINGGGGS